MASREFLEEYLARGMTEIYATNYSHEEEKRGYENEYTTQTVVAKKDGQFVECSVHLWQNFNPHRPERNLTVEDCIGISEQDYLLECKAEARVDTQEALQFIQAQNRLKQEKQQALQTLLASAPLCTSHHSQLEIKHNSQNNQPFWGCPRFPSCRVTRSFTSEHWRLYRNATRLN